MDRTCCGDASATAGRIAWPDEAQALRRQLRALESPCGCVAAAVALAATATAWVVLAQGPEPTPAPFHGAGNGAATLLAAAVAGKLAGILVARGRHALLHRRLRRLLQATGPAPASTDSR